MNSTKKPVAASCHAVVAAGACFAFGAALAPAGAFAGPCSN